MLWVLIFSIITLTILVGVKMFELWRERVSIVGRILSTMDPWVEKVVVFSFQKTEGPRRIIERFSVYGFSSYPKQTIAGLKGRVKEKYDLLYEKSRAKIDLKKDQRKDSPFWNSISEHKKNGLAHKKVEVDQWKDF